MCDWEVLDVIVVGAGLGGTGNRVVEWPIARGSHSARAGSAHSHSSPKLQPGT